MLEKMTVSATLDSLKTITEFVVNSAKSANLEKKKIYKLRLAIDELATNIISYGYAESNATGDIILECQITENSIEFKIIDCGIAFDPRTKLESEEETIEIPLEERQIGGLGIFLAFDGVDEFAYERQGDRNINTLTIYR
ncbi:ATP-binding protein [Geminocystis herdmanii]|uniref:ATP-binding protein n=1 Tax=Geminocystis herdmanii TaxID=669359 RepID=UPI00036FD666|nr:ATP-binding protein [Geminocystis herdmanii]